MKYVMGGSKDMSAQHKGARSRSEKDGDPCNHCERLGREKRGIGYLNPRLIRLGFVGISPI